MLCGSKDVHRGDVGIDRAGSVEMGDGTFLGLGRVKFDGSVMKRSSIVSEHQTVQVPVHSPYNDVFHTGCRTAPPATFGASVDWEPDRKRNHMESLSGQAKSFLVGRRSE